VTERRPLVLNVWSGAATVLIVAALVSLLSVLTGPYTRDDASILYSLGATLLAGPTFFAALVLIDRGGTLPGTAALLLAPVGWMFLVYALWIPSTSTSNADSEFWTGIVTLALALLVAASALLAQTPTARFHAVAAVGFAVVAALLSLIAAWGDEQFWRVGTTLTALWIAAATLFFLVPLVDRALRQSSLWLAGVPVVAGAGAAGIFALVSGPFSGQGYQIVFSLIAAALGGAGLLGGIVALERGAREVGLAAVALSSVALAMLLHGIWRDSDDRFGLIATGVYLCLAVLVAVSARLFASTPPSIMLAGVAGALAGLAALVAIDGIWRDDRYIPIQQTTTALWILATLCCILVPLLELYRASTEPEPEPETLPA
jgi:hypothetical protein